MTFIKDSYDFDAIVIGSGISGGWAAMELCEKGLKTLVLERGRDVKHIEDYPTAKLSPWEFEYGQNNTQQDIEDDPVQSQFYNPGNKHFFIRDKEQPYIQEDRFQWVRGNQVGGRSLVWGRQCYRFSDLDFEANSKDGYGVDWPIRYKDLSPWYDYVESFIGVSGEAKGLAHLPDGKFLEPMQLNCIERHLAEQLENNSADRCLTIARVANLTRGWNQRGPCRHRNLCTRGCPFGGYFSSNSSTLPAAFATGNLTLRPYSVVAEIIYDDTVQRATGVRIVDSITQESIVYTARVIFLNASTIATAAVLLNSTSSRFPDGLGNDSGQVGKNLMDHHSSAGAEGVYEGYSDKYYKGRRPCGFIIPRYRNLLDVNKSAFLRGYQLQGRGQRTNWVDSAKLSGFGLKFKEQLTTPGPWTIWLGGWGECLPYEENRVVLDKQKTDNYGIPLVKISFSFRENEKLMMNDIKETSAEMLLAAGFSNIRSFNYNKPGGSTVHEMGTVRMGTDSKTSVLNKYNQMHAVKNVFITDGSCMASSACQNPSLTYMALTARACNYAFSELQRGNI